VGTSDLRPQKVRVANDPDERFAAIHPLTRAALSASGLFSDQSKSRARTKPRRDNRDPTECLSYRFFASARFYTTKTHCGSRRSALHRPSTWGETRNPSWCQKNSELVGMTIDIPEGFEPHFRKSPLTDPWDALFQADGEGRGSRTAASQAAHECAWTRSRRADRSPWRQRDGL